MQKDKHNIYSKEELLKIIKEGKSAPADMDEFELEALDGLKLLEKPDVLNKLNKEVDEIITREKKKETQRKTIYYFGAAASLLLIVCLFFLLKNDVVVKNEKVVAEAEKPKEENMHLDLAPPTQAEAATTYEAKEPEQQNKPQKGTVVLAESKAKQKATETSNLEQATTTSTKNEAVAFAKDADEEKKEQEGSINQSIAANSGASSVYQENVQQDESKVLQQDKANKVVAASQPSMAFESRNQNSNVTQAPSSPKADSKKAEEKAQPDMFFANSLSKNKSSKNYKEPTFINGDSAFVAYAKQNLKISSPNNSGIIVVEFLIKNDGTTTDIKILKPLNTCEACSQDVIDFIKSIKKWQPATENEKAVSAIKKINLQYN
jgi:hypothetical protein